MHRTRPDRLVSHGEDLAVSLKSSGRWLFFYRKILNGWKAYGDGRVCTQFLLHINANLKAM